MAKKIGRLISVGFGKETTRGTVVAIAYWYPWLALGFNPKQTKAINTSARGRIEDADESITTESWAEGSIEGKIRANGIGYLILSMMGTDTPALVQTGVYDHVFTVDNSAIHQSLTIGIDDDEQDRRYANAVVGSLEFKVEMGKYIMFNASVTSMAAANATLSPSFTVDPEFTPKDVTVKLSDTSDFSGATAIPVKALTFKLEQNAERDQVVGAVSPADILNKQFHCEAEMELLSQDDTYYGYFAASTAKYMQILIKDTSTTIGASSNPTITIVLNKTQITDYQRTQNPDDFVMIKLKFQAFYNVSDSKMLTITVRNTLSAY